MSIRCLIVDDEPLARRVLEKHIDSLDFLKLAGQCSNALEAADFLHKHPVDLMFLDIKMPRLTGLDFLKTLTHPPKVILTTAFSEYALEGYEYSVVDYLLKPISFERFLKAVQKVSPPRGKTFKDDAASRTDFIFIREDKVDHKIRFSEIRFVEGYGNFVKVVTNERIYLTAETMTGMENRLPGEQFMRVHKSYIVAMDRIDRIVGNTLRLEDDTIPIGKTYKRAVETRMDRFRTKKP